MTNLTTERERGDPGSPGEGWPKLSQAIAALRAAPSLIVLIDYDGSLVPIAQTPELAVPDAALHGLLAALAASPSLDVHIVSGRSRNVLERWLGHLRISLWAEHGCWCRPTGRGEWAITTLVPLEAIDRIYPMLAQFTASTPGSRLEKKSASIAWHYRLADPNVGARRAQELCRLLEEALRDQPLELLEGRRVIEVRARGITKALCAQRILADGTTDAAILAIGDDRTDEDLFAALPASSVTVAVGRPLHGAKFQVPNFEAVRNLLEMLLSGEPDADH